MTMEATPIEPKHQEFLDEHFGISPQWKQFHRKLRGKHFASAVMQDTRSDKKLKRFTKNFGTRQQSKSPGVEVPGDTGAKYKIKYHPELDRFSCGCGDWTYARSVKNKGRGGDCKHIKRMKWRAKRRAMKKMASALAGSALRLARTGYMEEKMKDTAKKRGISHKAYKKHFPREGLLVAFAKRASIRGRAARALLDSFQG
jgi:hypothetical protein